MFSSILSIVSHSVSTLRKSRYSALTDNSSSRQTTFGGDPGAKALIHFRHPCRGAFVSEAGFPGALPPATVRQPSGLTSFKLAAFALVTTSLVVPSALFGHGFEGDRFFPPTIQTDDPFSTDELNLPTISIFNNPAGDGSPKTREIDISSEFDKEIFPGFALGITGAYTVLQPKGGPQASGWDNISVSAKYQLLQIPAHEFIFSVGAEWEIGGSGRFSMVNNYSTISPNIYFGKGFGDLPDSLRFLKPFAITGQLAEDFAVRSVDPNVFEWGFALEYSLPYLQEHVKDVGLGRPFRDMIPLVEFSMQTLENRGSGGTTGTINPGVLWEGKYCQIGAEAMIPVNRQTGPNIGVVISVQIYIDDIFPKLFGHPLIGGGSSSGSSSSGYSK